MNTKQLYKSVYKSLRLLDAIFDVAPIPEARAWSIAKRADLVISRLDMLEAVNPTVYHAAYQSYLNRYNAFVG